MWLSKKAAEKNSSGIADIGSVTIGGESVGVFASGERRGLRVCAPGGYFWRPKASGEMLIIKCDDGSEVAAGAPCCGYPDGMQNGEVYIKSDGGAALWLKNDGSAVIFGAVQIIGGLSVNGNEIG
ncbi:MAG: hypothetical protein ACI3VB_05045 [Oscillospiraceae bacterium]